MAKRIEKFEEFLDTLTLGGMLSTSFEVPENSSGIGAQVVPYTPDELAARDALLKGMDASQAQEWLDRPQQSNKGQRGRIRLVVPILQPNKVDSGRTLIPIVTRLRDHRRIQPA